MFSSCGQKENMPVFSRGPSEKAVSSTKEESDEEGEEKDVDISDLFIVEELNLNEENIIVKSMSTGSLFRYPYALATKFLDKYGNYTSTTAFRSGEVVTLGKTMNDGALLSITLSDKVERLTDVKNFSIDKDRNLFSYNGDNYILSDDTEIFSENLPYDITAISDNDVLDIIYLNKDLVSINISTGHGYIALTNTSTFDNTLIEIGEKIRELINGDMTIEVPEGNYDVTVAANGYGGTTNVTVSRGETVYLDLDTLKGEGPKSSTIVFRNPSSVENAHIYLDNQEIAFDTENIVTYGKHSLKITADGYEDWNKTLFVNSPSADISLDLSTDSDSDTGSDSTSNDATTSTAGTASGDTGTDAASGTSNSSADTNSTINSLANSLLNGSSSDSGSTSSTENSVDYLSTLSNLLNSLSGSSQTDK